MGRFSRQKNHEALLQMMLQLPSANLVLVGDGELRSEIELLAQQMKLEKRVHFFGEISPEAVRAVMRACDLMVFPSSYEAMPMALLEAMAAGMAIVASDIPAHRELLADCGVIARADPSSLAEAATRLLADRDAAAGFARKAIERARQFTIEASADGYERVFGARPSFSTSGASAEPGSRFPGYRLAGMRVHAITRHELVEIAVEAVHKEKRCVIANQNLHGLYCWFQERKVREFQRSADYTHIDGMSLVLLGWMLGLPLRRDHRTGYMDLLPPLAREAAARHWRVFYLGSKLGVAEKAAVELRKQYPGLQVRTHHGHFDTRMSGRENQEVLAEINAYAPNVLLVGMGMPRQGMWILENRNQISANVVFCCGALMDYVAGEIPTPPRWVGPLGLEWLLRLLSEPGRLWYRYLVEPWFVFSQIARYYLRNPGKRHGREQQQ